MNTLFKNNDEIKRRIFNRNIHKAMQIPVNIYQTNTKFFVKVQQKMHVNWNLQIIYGYHFFINLSLTLYFLNTYFSYI